VVAEEAEEKAKVGEEVGAWEGVVGGEVGRGSTMYLSLYFLHGLRSKQGCGVSGDKLLAEDEWQAKLNEMLQA